MGKRYDDHVTPQNTPRFKERRIVLMTAFGLLIFNLLVTGIFFSSNPLAYILWALFVAVIAIIQYFDRRREMWSYGYVFTLVSMLFIVSAFLPLSCDTLWLFTGYGIELIGYIFLAVHKLKRRPSKPRKK